MDNYRLLLKPYTFAFCHYSFYFFQGTFSVYERFSEVYDFVKENLEHDGLPFVLNTPTGHKFEENDKDSSLADLRLVPATILIFQWDNSVEEDLNAAGNITYLKPEVTLLVQSL